jgi:hypothetical protein
MDEIISYKMCAVKVRNAKLRNYLNSKMSINWHSKVPSKKNHLLYWPSRTKCPKISIFPIYLLLASPITFTDELVVS